MQPTELKPRKEILTHAHLQTGEPVWIVRLQRNLWRVSSIPVSTERVRYADIVRLNISADGDRTIESVEKRGGYAAALIVMHKDGAFPSDFVSKLNGLVPWEKIDKTKIAVAVTEDTWKSTCDHIEAHGLRAFRLAQA